MNKFKVGDRVRVIKYCPSYGIEATVISIDDINKLNRVTIEFEDGVYFPSSIDNLELIEEECELKTGDKALFWDCEGDTKEEKIFISKDNNKKFPFIAVSPDDLEDYKRGIAFCCDFHMNCEPIEEVTKEEELEARIEYLENRMEQCFPHYN